MSRHGIVSLSTHSLTRISKVLVITTKDYIDLMSIHIGVRF